MPSSPQKAPPDNKMMSLKTWLIILFIYVAYLLSGGGIFWCVNKHFSKRATVSFPLPPSPPQRYLENPEDCLNKERANDLGKDIRSRIRNITGRNLSVNIKSNILSLCR